jgi:trimeric autotransporter adhesin
MPFVSDSKRWNSGRTPWPRRPGRLHGGCAGGAAWPVAWWGWGVLTWALPVVTADDAKKGLEQRVAALEQLLTHFRRDGNEVFLEGANLHIVNGLGATQTMNELGNLIVGYNEPREEEFGPNARTGSHNVVVGEWHNFSSFGGIVVGFQNQISGTFSSVSGGESNVASGDKTSVSGGARNEASGPGASVSGGFLNKATNSRTSVSGGAENTATGFHASVSGGIRNEASGSQASVSGGNGNTASGQQASVSGGENNEARGQFSSVSGGENNFASGIESSVSGGKDNEAAGEHTSVSGGREVIQDAKEGWAAGSIGGEGTGSFRSP